MPVLKKQEYRPKKIQDLKVPRIVEELIVGYFLFDQEDVPRIVAKVHQPEQGERDPHSARPARPTLVHQKPHSHRQDRYGEDCIEGRRDVHVDKIRMSCLSFQTCTATCSTA